MFTPNTTSRPPPDMVIPYDEQMWFTIATQIPFVIFFGQGILNWVRRNDPTALFFGIGGCFASAFEPIVDVMGCCFFPREGNWVAFETFGRPIPLFVPATYGWFVGGMGYWFSNILRNPETTRSTLWAFWFKAFLINLILEYPPLYVGIYTYYGYQPFSIGGFPLWFPLTNATTPMVAATIVNLIGPHLKGWRKIAIITTTASAYGLANSAFGFPVWSALSTDLGYHVTYPAAIITLGLQIMGVWIMSLQVPEGQRVVLNGRRKSRKD